MARKSEVVLHYEKDCWWADHDGVTFTADTETGVRRAWDDDVEFVYDTAAFLQSLEEEA